MGKHSSRHAAPSISARGGAREEQSAWLIGQRYLHSMFEEDKGSWEHLFNHITYCFVTVPA